jgi:hypothetical protein
MKFVLRQLIYEAGTMFRVNKLEFPCVVLLRKFLGEAARFHIYMNCVVIHDRLLLGHDSEQAQRGFIDDVFDKIYENSALVYGSIRKLNGRISVEYMVGLLLERRTAQFDKYEYTSFWKWNENTQTLSGGLHIFHSIGYWRGISALPSKKIRLELIVLATVVEVKPRDELN